MAIINISGETGAELYIYTPNKITNGLVGHWTLAENNYSGGVFIDKSGNGHDGTPANAPMFTANHSGLANSATVFNGATDAVTINASVDFQFTDGICSWAFWAYMTTDKRLIINKEDSGNMGWNIQCAGTNKLQFWYGNSVKANYYIQTPNNVYTQSTWQFIVLICNGTTLTFYVNDSQVHSAPLEALWDGSTRDIIIGNYYTYNVALDGAISDVRLYNRVLSESEINTLYITEGLILSGLMNISGETGVTLNTELIVSLLQKISGETGAELDTSAILSKLIDISGETSADLDTLATLSGLYNISGDTSAELYLRNFLTIYGDSNRKGIMKGY